MPISAPVSVSIKANLCWLHLIRVHSQTPCLGSISRWRLSLKDCVCLLTSLTCVIQLSKSVFQAWEIIVHVEKKLVVLCYKESRFISVKTSLDFWKLYCLESMCMSPNMALGDCLIFHSRTENSLRENILHKQQSSSQGVTKLSHKRKRSNFIKLVAYFTLA